MNYFDTIPILHVHRFNTKIDYLPTLQAFDVFVNSLAPLHYTIKISRHPSVVTVQIYGMVHKHRRPHRMLQNDKSWGRDH